MGPRSVSVLALVVGLAAAGAGAAFLLLSDLRGVRDASLAGRDEAHLTERCDRLAERVAALERAISAQAHVEPVPPTIREPVPAAGTRSSDLAARLDAVEARVAAMAREQPVLESELAMVGEPTSFREMIDLEYRQEKREQIAIKEAALRRFPDDSNAPAILRQLVNDCASLGGPALARKAMAQLGARVPLADYQQAQIEAQLCLWEKNGSGARAALERVIGSPRVGDYERLQARVQHAHSYLDDGDFGPARAEAQAILDEYPAAKDKDPFAGFFSEAREILAQVAKQR
ncbi:MAG: hypothetical protein U1E76_25800 [Planctomycetota bacterium]